MSPKRYKNRYKIKDFCLNRFTPTKKSEAQNGVIELAKDYGYEITDAPVASPKEDSELDDEDS